MHVFFLYTWLGEQLLVILPLPCCGQLQNVECANSWAYHPQFTQLAAKVLLERFWAASQCKKRQGHIISCQIWNVNVLEIKRDEPSLNNSSNNLKEI